MRLSPSQLITPLNDTEFVLFQKLIFDAAGVRLDATKKPLVASRLADRVRQLSLPSYNAYFDLIGCKGQERELETAIHRLTTHETHFFREPEHFQFLRHDTLPRYTPGYPLRVWSAACSTGEEVYTLAMAMTQFSPTQSWEILGSDVSMPVLETAQNGQYPLDRAKGMPDGFLAKYCQKGVGAAAETFTIRRELRQKIRFMPINLAGKLPDVGEFDIIFLRNVMIYFPPDVKHRVATSLVQKLKPGGHIFVGHAETLSGVCPGITRVKSSIFRKL